MYTEREKVRYVEMMWAEGLTPCAANRKWGCPSRGILSKWIKEAEAGILPAERPRVVARVERVGRTHYPETTRAEAVRLYRLGEKPRHIARRLGLDNSSIVSVWVQKDRKKAMLSETGAQDATRKDADKADTKVSKAVEKDDRETVALRAELAEALLEASAYKELMRDPKAGGLASLSKRRLVGLGESLRRDYRYSLVQILTFLGISKSTYHYHRAKLNNPQKTLVSGFDQEVVDSFAKNKGIYGYRRLKAELIRSMSRKGHSPDNAACEGFFGRMKVELFHSLVRAKVLVAELFKAAESYISWYNAGRLKTFKENGKKVFCETIDGRRRRLGLAT